MNPLAPGETFAQHNVGGVIYSAGTTVTGSQTDWDGARIIEMPLSRFEKMHRRSEEHRALETLNKKIKVLIDDKYILPTQKAIFRRRFFLDFFAVIPSSLGLSVVLPPIYFERTINWVFELDLSKPNRPFRFKHGKLGYHPENAVTSIGTHGHLDIWTIFVKEDELLEAQSKIPAGTSHAPNTMLVARHLRMYHSWILYLLAKINYPGITCRPTRYYDVDLESKDSSWDFAVGFKYVSSLWVMEAKKRH
jgi:hypothetical protein